MATPIFVAPFSESELTPADYYARTMDQTDKRGARINTASERESGRDHHQLRRRRQSEKWRRSTDRTSGITIIRAVVGTAGGRGRAGAAVAVVGDPRSKQEGFVPRGLFIDGGRQISRQFRQQFRQKQVGPISFAVLHMYVSKNKTRNLSISSRVRLGLQCTIAPTLPDRSVCEG